MNCGDFRYLIQRRFDVELSPADDRALLIHLETCDSCQKFYHQVQQVIIAAEELELTEDVLPNNPDQLLNSIMENIPQEKQGIKALVLSFLSKLGMSPNNSGGLGTTDISPSAADSAMMKRLPGYSGAALNENKSNVQPASPSFNSPPVTDWGRPAQPTTNYPISGETNEPITHAPTQAPARMPEERVVTRSLSEKFGVSGSANVLANTQPLTLAESIRQKISEMSKTGNDYTSEPQSVELPVAEPADEWSVPHSPEWPKLKIDASPDQWPNDLSGAKAPNTWGNPDAGWGTKSLELDILANQIPEYNPQNKTPVSPVSDSQITAFPSPTLPSAPEKSEPAVSKPFGWSAEAEQMETGTWQTVQFDTTLGANVSSFPSPSNSLPNQPTAAPVPTSAPFNSSIESTQMPLAAEPVEVQNEILPVNLPITSTESTKDAVQSFVPAGSNGPKIYPVVSRRAKSSTSITSLNALSSPPDQSLSPSPESLIEPELPTVELTPPSNPTSNEVPAETVDFTIVKQPKTSLPFVASVQSPEVIIPPPPPPSLSPSSPSPSIELEKATEIVEEDNSRLFRFDDGAIDKLFSNNLGVHERSIPAQTARSSNLPEPVLPGSAPSSSQTTNFPPPSVVPPPAISVPNAVPAEATQQPLFEFSPPVTETPVTNQLPVSAPPEPVSNSPIAPTPTGTDQNQKKSSGMFVIDDNMIDRIFTDHLGVPEQISKNAVDSATNKGSSPAPETSIQKPILDTRQPVTDSPEPLAPADIPVVSATPSIEKFSAQFGSAPGQSSGKQKVVGVGKLDSRVEPIADTGSGRIASIGKFLLDNKDLEKIGRITSSDLSEGKLRTLTLEANDELKGLLKQIDAQQGVIGTLIVGHDGLLIAHTMSQDNDAETLGVEALAVYMGTVQVVEKLGDDNVRQIVSQTNQGYLIVANFGAGLLVTLTNPMTLDYLLPLMRTVTQLVASA